METIIHKINLFFDYFIFEKDKQENGNYRKARFFVGSLLFLSIANFIFFLVIIYNADPVHRERLILTSTLVTLCMLLPLVLYKKFGNRNLLANIFLLIIYFGLHDTYYYAGGLYSVDLIWYVIVMPTWATMATNKFTGIFWTLLSLAFVAFLGYAEMNHWVNFKEMGSKITPFVMVFNLFMSGFLIMSFSYVYETNNEKNNKEISGALEEIKEKNLQLESKNEEIISSINYAQRIQYAILPPAEAIHRTIPESFVFFKPKDIVSGDFYWFYEIEPDNYLIVCADCTGHGVPGAFMTVLGSSIISQIVIDNKCTSPSEILKELDERLTRAIKQQNGNDQNIKDGMDISILNVNQKEKRFSVAAAKRPVYWFNQHQLTEIPGSKHTIGGHQRGEKNFEETVADFKEGDMIYLFTDGLPDQFGGPLAKKFMIKKFRELLSRIHTLPVVQQIDGLEKNILAWMEKNEQTDDMLVIGIQL